MEIQLLDPRAKVPVRKHSTDAGYDIHCLEDFTIHPEGQFLVKTGIAIALPDSTAGLVWNRSGLSCGTVSRYADGNTDQGVDTTAGLIDMGYRGELIIALNNNSSLTKNFKAGERIAQLLLVPVVTPELVVVDVLPSADRGDNGFGSTGR